MEQNTIVCDAAFAISNAFVATFGENVLVIMCWFHVKEAIEWQLTVIVNEKNQAAILSDIEYLHLASNSTIFNNAVQLFLLKWLPTEPDFCEYFRNVWINQHPNWFIGAATYIPCHNNALESSNRYLKVKKLFYMLQTRKCGFFGVLFCQSQVWNSYCFLWWAVLCSIE